MRRALSPAARRAGYVGSLIMYCDIHEHGKIAIIRSHIALKKEAVVKNYAMSAKIKVDSMNFTRLAYGHYEIC